MKLAKKVTKPVYEEKEKEYVYKKPPYVDWKTHTVDMLCELPYGKYREKTLQWVKDNDDWYFSWILDNKIINSWGLYKRKKEKEIKDYGLPVEEPVYGPVPDLEELISIHKQNLQNNVENNRESPEV